MGTEHTLFRIKTYKNIFLSEKFLRRIEILKMPLENLIRFPALGDWGGTEYASYYVPLQEWNAQLMDDLCAEDSCDFVVSVGDNFYETGVKNIGLLNQN